MGKKQGHSKKIPLKLTSENPYFKEKRRPFLVDPQTSVDDILDSMSKTAFQGRSLGEAFKIWQEILEDPNITIFMGYAGSLSSAGMWKIVNWMISERFIDVLVSTGANVSEDIFEAMGLDYWLGDSKVNDRDLLKYRINRFYDHYAAEIDYLKLEGLIRDFMQTLDQKTIYSSRSFLYEFGKYLYDANEIYSLAAIASREKVPIFSPALIDSGYGEAALMSARNGHPIIIDQSQDMCELAEIGQKALAEKRKTAVIFIGGGVPKDMIQMISVSLSVIDGRGAAFPHDYAIQITTDSPQWGGLSGCTIAEEAISWGKESDEGKNATVYCDATIALPIIASALSQRIVKRKNPPDFSWLFEKSVRKI